MLRNISLAKRVLIITFLSPLNAQTIEEEFYTQDPSMGNNKKKKNRSKSRSKSAVGGRSVPSTTTTTTTNANQKNDLLVPEKAEEDVSGVPSGTVGATTTAGATVTGEEATTQRGREKPQTQAAAAGMTSSRSHSMLSSSQHHDVLAEQQMVKVLKRVQAVVRGWKTRAKLSAELAKASMEL